MSSDRYISQNALITEIAKIHGNLNTKNVGQAIWDTPTADVVAVVRCKDCKHWGGVTYGQICRKYSGFETKVCTEKDHYCSYGERKMRGNEKSKM